MSFVLVVLDRKKYHHTMVKKVVMNSKLEYYVIHWMGPCTQHETSFSVCSYEKTGGGQIVPTEKKKMKIWAATAELYQLLT